MLFQARFHLQNTNEFIFNETWGIFVPPFKIHYTKTYSYRNRKRNPDESSHLIQVIWRDTTALYEEQFNLGF